MDFLRLAGDIYRQADKAAGGWLPGGGTASPATAAIQAITKPNQVERAKAAIKSSIEKAVDPRYARDVVLNSPIVPEPERRFVQAMTGGIPGDVVTELPPEFLSYIKDAYLSKQALRDNNTEPYGELFSKFFPSKNPESNQISTYGYGRDIQNSLGEVGLWRDKQGNVLIKDRWKVDNSSMSGPEGGEANLPTKRFYSDLGEGGAIASWLFNKAREAGTYRPFDYEVRIPAKEWDAIEPKSGDEQFDKSFVGKQRDFLYDVLSHMVAPNAAPKPKRNYGSSSSPTPSKFFIEKPNAPTQYFAP